MTEEGLQIYAWQIEFLRFCLDSPHLRYEMTLLWEIRPQLTKCKEVLEVILQEYLENDVGRSQISPHLLGLSSTEAFSFHTVQMPLHRTLEQTRLRLVKDYEQELRELCLGPGPEELDPWVELQ